MKTYREFVELVRDRELGESEITELLEELLDKVEEPEFHRMIIFQILSYQPVKDYHIKMIKKALRDKKLKNQVDSVLKSNMYLNRDSLIEGLRKREGVIVDNTLDVIRLKGTYVNNRENYDSYGSVFQNGRTRLEIPISSIIYLLNDLSTKILYLQVRDCSVIKTWWRRNNENL